MADRQIDELSFATDISDATTFAANNNAATYEAQQVSVGQIATFMGARADAVHNLGDLHYNKSNLAIDNPGAVPGWTGEYVTNANNVYPDLYTWLKTSHPELCVTRAQYDTAIIATDECKYFVIDEEAGSIRFPKYKYVAPDYPWIYVFNAAVPQSTTQGAAYTEALVGKASIDLSNLNEAGEIKIGQNARNIGEIVPSALPLTSAGLHLLDGSVLQGSGSYSAFVTYIKRLYQENPNASYFAKTTQVPSYSIGLVGNTVRHNAEVTGFYEFNGINYAYIPTQIDTSSASSWEFTVKVELMGYTTTAQAIIGNTTDAGSGGGMVIRNYDSTRIYCWMTSNNSSWDIMSKFDTGIDYRVGMNYLKLTFDGSVYRFFSSEDGETWTQKNQLQSTAKMSAFANYPRLGASASGYPLQYGSIYLDGTSWKINGSTVWSGITYTEYSPLDYWTYCVNKYGSCGKFVYDSANNTVRLPKISNIIEGTTDLTALGDLVEAGLPDVYLRMCGAGEGTIYARLGPASKTGITAGDNGSNTRISRADVWSSDIYGKSDTVQPQTIKVLFYIVVANAAKTEIQVDIDSIATDLNSKVDKSELREVAVVVDSYNNGTVWWRQWSDGWIEQGGRIEESGVNVVYVSFPKPFATFPSLLTSVNSIKRTTYLDNGIDVFGLSTTGFTKQYTVNVGTGWSWYACGYVNE